MIGVLVGSTVGDLTSTEEGKTVDTFAGTEVASSVGAFDGDTLLLAPGCRLRGNGAGVEGFDTSTEGLIETIGTLVANGADVLTMG